MKFTLIADGSTDAGGSALVMHNERLADPLDEFTRAIAAISKKRGKSEADHEEIGRLEFLGGLYTDPRLGLEPAGHGEYRPVIPAWNMLRCLQDGAKRIKRGQDVLAGVYPLAEVAPVIFDGPTDPWELWRDGRFKLRKTVGVQRARTMRTRPIFTEWRLELPIEVDMDVWDLDALTQCWRMAGTYKGLGEMRPVYGRFAGVLESPSAAKAAKATTSRKSEKATA